MDLGVSDIDIADAEASQPFAIPKNWGFHWQQYIPESFTVDWDTLPRLFKIVLWAYANVDCRRDYREWDES